MTRMTPTGHLLGGTAAGERDVVNVSYGAPHVGAPGLFSPGGVDARRSSRPPREDAPGIVGHAGRRGRGQGSIMGEVTGGSSQVRPDGRTASPHRVGRDSGATVDTISHVAAEDPTVVAARAGDDAAWRQLYDELAPGLRRYARVRGATDPDDVVGETFVHLARGIERFSGDRSAFRSWAFTVAHHRVIDDHRRRSRRPEDRTDPADLQDHLAVEDTVPELGALGELLGALTDEQRAVIVHRIVADESIEATAAAMGKPVTAIKALQRRATSRLRRLAHERGLTEEST